MLSAISFVCPGCGNLSNITTAGLFGFFFTSELYGLLQRTPKFGAKRILDLLFMHKSREWCFFSSAKKTDSVTLFLCPGTPKSLGQDKKAMLCMLQECIHVTDLKKLEISKQITLWQASLYKTWSHPRKLVNFPSHYFFSGSYLTQHLYSVPVSITGIKQKAVSVLLLDVSSHLDDFWVCARNKKGAWAVLPLPWLVLSST